MKNKGFIFLIAFVAGLALIYTGCSKDEAPALAAISGKVTYPAPNGNAMDAAGAIVRVYSGAAATGDFIAVVANETGMYKVEGLATGEYFLTAAFNTENKNLKSDGVDGMSFASAGVAVTASSTSTVQNIELTTIASAGTAKISTADGNWAKESHSKITWKTLYHGEAAQLVGGFNNFGIKELIFDEANPSSSSIKAWVQLSSINTFEPARDAVGHCVTDDLGVDYDAADTAADGSLNLPSAIDATTDTAWFNSKSVAAYGNGYLAKGDLIFKGVTKEIDMFFVYKGTYDIPGRTGGSDPFAVFEGEFTFDAANDYNVDYSGGDEIEVNIHLQMKGPHKE